MSGRAVRRFARLTACSGRAMIGASLRRKRTMRQGYRVIDADTHVYPALDVLMRYADQELREYADELKPYTRPEGEHTALTVAPIRYNRVAGSRDAGAAQIQAGAANNLA